MKRVVFAALILFSICQSTLLGSASARTSAVSINLQPQRVVELSTAEQAKYFPGGQYTDTVGNDTTSKIDAARPGIPYWDVVGGNYSANEAWVGVKYTFNTKAVLQCAQNGSLRVRQLGSYTATAASDNTSTTSGNDARQYLASQGNNLQMLKFPGGISPGSSKRVNMYGSKVDVTRAQLNVIEVVAAVQAKDVGNKLDWDIDNLRINVEYVNTCTTSANRYNQPVFSEIDEFTNVPYRVTSVDGGEPVTLKLDVFRPKNDTIKFRPLIVFVHGGGYTWGSKEDINYAARWYAQAGYTTASIDYRLIPGGQQNPPLERIIQALNDSTLDTKDAIRYLSTRSAAYGIDTNKVAVVGWSAGGATSLAQQLARPAHDQESAYSTFVPSTHAIVSGSGYLGPPIFPEIKAKKPSILMINWLEDTANSDENNADNNSFARLTCDSFRAAGVDCSLILKPGSGHDIDFTEESTSILPFLRQQLRL